MEGDLKRGKFFPKKAGERVWWAAAGGIKASRAISSVTVVRAVWSGAGGLPRVVIFIDIFRLHLLAPGASCSFWCPPSPVLRVGHNMHAGADAADVADKEGDTGDG